jgi:signal transduction histidine kinase
METIADRLVLPLGTLWILLGWGIALIPSLQTETARVLASLNRSAEQLREELVRLNTAYRLQQQAIARALHGPIQDALSVAAFKLSAAIKDGTANQKLVGELNEMISSTIVLLDLPDEEQPALEQSLADLAEFWDGVAKIRYKLTPAAKRVLATHPVTSATAIELIREACSNAVRHGKASQIRVEVSVSKDQNRLELNVSNDGSLVKMTTKPGLGTKLLNELALRWNLRSAGSTTVLDAITPVI